MSSRSRTSSVVIGTIIAFVLQVAVAPYLAIGGVAAEVALVFVAVNALSTTQTKATLSGFILGAAVDLATGTPLGIRAMSYSLVAFAINPLAASTTLENLFARFLAIVSMAFAGELIIALLMSIVGVDNDLAHTLMARVMPGGLYDSLVGLLMMPLANRPRALGQLPGSTKAKTLKETLPPL